MKTTMVRYKVKPGKSEENQALIAKVFEALGKSRPAGLRYASFLMPDGLSFVHVATIEDESKGNPLTPVPAFQAFVADIRARCDEPPAPVELTLVGNYRLVQDG